MSQEELNASTGPLPSDDQSDGQILRDGGYKDKAHFMLSHNLRLYNHEDIEFANQIIDKFREISKFNRDNEHRETQEPVCEAGNKYLGMETGLDGQESFELGTSGMGASTYTQRFESRGHDSEDCTEHEGFDTDYFSSDEARYDSDEEYGPASYEQEFGSSHHDDNSDVYYDSETNYGGDSSYDDAGYFDSGSIDYDYGSYDY